MDIEKVKWMFALWASDSGIVEHLLLILNIPQYDFNLKFCDCNHKFHQHISNLPIHLLLHRVEQQISLTYLETKHFLFRGSGGFFSFTLPKHLCVFSDKICCNETTVPRDLMQRDDGAESSVRWPWILLGW
ncbi:uncharacterized protein G2W53_015033 [Senna tora]|uniref:Uncharacterized protein n=1 Tax=Senna tora TaxID=362788 RepID=A0A834WUD5_9FABA|nr:uncharacterized protein G2W53_015033 [Senna tora]